MNKGSTKKKKRVAVLMGGKSAEREISMRSGEAVLNALTRLGYNAIGIDAGEDVIQRIQWEGVEMVFVALHGRWGEDGVIQGLLETMEIPYTGSGVLGSAAAMDKVVMKLILEGLKIPTPSYAVTRQAGETDFPLPFVVKPAREGSTIGISVVRSAQEVKKALKNALRYDRKLLLEEFVEGKEITVAVINGTVLPVIEVRPASGFYDYEAKYTKGRTQYIVPAKVPKRVEEKACATALSVWEAFDLAGCARIDMLVRRGTPLVIDINTSPGMTETSLVPKAWVHVGGTFDGLVEEILAGASLKA
jgi:D-alanine-D-alanine ligase